MQRGSGAARQTGKWPVTFDGSRAGQNLGSPTAYYDAAYPQTVTLVDGAISQLNDFNGNGNNATQSTAANRPVLSRADNRENRVIDSDVIAPATYWAGTRAAFDGTTISKAGKTLKYLKEDATAANTHFVGGGAGSQYIPSVNGQDYIVRFIAYSTTRFLSVRLLNGRSTADYSTFNLTTGAIEELGAGFLNASTVSNGDGSYTCQITVTANATVANAGLGFYLYNATTRTYNGDNTSGVYLGDVSLRRTGTDLLTTATTTFPQYAGINGNAVPVFDGSNDSLTTAIAVNPTGGMWGAAVVGVNSFATTSAIFSVRNLAATDRINWWITAGGAMELAVCSDSYSVTKIARTAPAGTIVANTPCILSFTYDGGTSSTGIKIYKNGVRVDTGNNNSGVYAVPTAGGNLSIGQSNTNNYFSGYLSPAIFGQGSQWSDANRQAWEQYLLQRFIPNYVWFSPDANVTSVDGAVASWTDTTNVYVASQSTAANRPILSRTDNRENRYAYSNDISNAYWTKARVTVPNFESLIEDSSTGLHSVVKTLTTAEYTSPTQSFTVSADIGAAGRNRARVLLYFDGSNFYGFIVTDIAAGVVTETSSGSVIGISRTATLLPNGKLRITISGSYSLATAAGIYINIQDSGGNNSYLGDGVSGININNLSMRRTTTEDVFVPTTTYSQLAGLNNNQAFVYDGSNDSLATNLAVNPTGGMAGAVVVRPNSLHVGSIYASHRTAATADQRLQWFVGNTGAITLRVKNGSSNYIGRTTPASSYAANEAFILSWTYDGGTSASGIKIYKNGVAIDNANDNLGTYTLPTAGSNLEIGSQSAGVDTFFSGYLADAVFVQGRTMSNAERQNYEQRFMQKYNIS